MATEQKFEIGDTVFLNSGGPIMTVNKVGIYTSTDAVQCIWFDESKLLSQEFYTSVLTKST